jgi:hypothetical protein
MHKHNVKETHRFLWLQNSLSHSEDKAKIEGISQQNAVDNIWTKIVVCSLYPAFIIRLNV